MVSTKKQLSSKQIDNPADIIKLMPKIEVAIENAVGIEVHNNRYYYDTETVNFAVCSDIRRILMNAIVVNDLKSRRDTNGAYALIGLSETNNEYVVTRMIAQKRTWKLTDYEMLYAIKKQTVSKTPRLSPKGVSGSSVFYRIADFLDIVNRADIAKNVFSADVLEKLSSSRGRKESITDNLMYSDRIIPSNKAEEALRKENEKMKSEIGNLREFVRLQGKLTGGKMFTRSSLGIVAKEITKFAFAKGDTTELVPLLNDIYGYIASGDEVSWEGIVERSQPVIEWLRKHEYTPRAKRTADAQQMLSELRDVSVRLSETQR